MADDFVGLMTKPKYNSNIIRTGDIGLDAPYTVMTSSVSNTIIRLPLPQTLTSSMTADWQQESVSVARYALMHGGIDKISSFKDQFAGASGVGGSLSVIMNNMPELGVEMKALMARATNETNTVTGPKVVLNPRNEMLFNGMGFKSYSFTFTLTPMKEEDSKNIQAAIIAIQRASVPDLRGAKMFMEYPETWRMFFMDSNNYLMRINECCCTRVDVNYSPNGSSYQVHPGNAPLSVELTLDLCEVVIPSKENIDKFNG